MAGNDGMCEAPRSRTILWCVPRSGSTVLTKCLSFIDGIETWFEPYSYCRVSHEIVRYKLNLDLPPVYRGNEDAFRQTADVIDRVWSCKSNPEHFSFSSIKSFLESSSRQHVFVKDIGFTMERKDYGFLPEGYTHTFLIRHPLRVFGSFRKTMYTTLSENGLLSGVGVDEQSFDLGCKYPSLLLPDFMFKDLYDKWKSVREISGSTPIVIDGDDLLSNPAEILPKYCRAVGLPYNESLLNWDASTAVLKDWKFPADGMIESLQPLYGRAANSSKFIPPMPMPDRRHVTPDVIRCVDQNMVFYNEMYNARIRI